MKGEKKWKDVVKEERKDRDKRIRKVRQYFDRTWHWNFSLDRRD